MLGSQPFEGCEERIEVHVNRARDHTRGLLEVTASVAVSTAHAVHDVAVVIAQGHARLPLVESVSHSARSGEADRLSRYDFADRARRSARIGFDAVAREEAHGVAT